MRLVFTAVLLVGCIARNNAKDEKVFVLSSIYLSFFLLASLRFVSPSPPYCSLIHSFHFDVSQCEWSSNTGVAFDLNRLTKVGDQTSYMIKDGDIPCTPETEPTYSFLWNFCADVTEVSMPSICPTEKRGAAIQYLIRKDDYTEVRDPLLS